jgi:hypothetical protein
MYFAIIGDIISSRKIENRKLFQKQLSAVLDDINRAYSQDIASKFVITLGDEFQGLLKRADRLLEITDKIKFQLEPVEIRFGIGVGRMITEIIPETSVGADGPAYWCARNAILLIHEKNDYNVSKIIIEAEEQNDFVDVINESLRLCDYMEKKWRSSQKKMVKKSVLQFGHSKIPQKELAALLNLSVQTVNVKIQSTGYYNYLRLKKSVCQALQNHWGDQ